MLRLTVLSVAAVLLAACSQAPVGPPTSTDRSGSLGGNKQLETPNSLPRGFTTSHPFAPASGQVTTRTGS